jgi:hypothetical protein
VEGWSAVERERAGRGLAKPGYLTDLSQGPCVNLNAG